MLDRIICYQQSSISGWSCEF